MNDLVSKMIDFRARFNFSQKKLAEICGLSSQTIYLIENGKHFPTKKTRRKIEIRINDYLVCHQNNLEINNAQ